MILLRNLYPKEGLCNGTRMVVTYIGRRCIEARILGGSFDSQLRVIPRIKLTSTEDELPYVVSRRQFPLRLCFAMTIDKSQGQSFNYVGVDLRIPLFTHGQLYVALSQVTNMPIYHCYCQQMTPLIQTILFIQRYYFTLNLF